MFKYIEAVLVARNVCTSIDNEITGTKGITYKMVIHFICALPEVRRDVIYNSFKHLNETNGNIEYYFHSILSIYLNTLKPALPLNFSKKNGHLITN
jgi:hypothetical protein